MSKAMKCKCGGTLVSQKGERYDPEDIRPNMRCKKCKTLYGVTKAALVQLSLPVGKGPDQKRHKGDVLLWFADRKLATCYKVSAKPYSAHDKKAFDLRYWVKPHNAHIVEEVEIGKGLFKTRESAYAWLILSLNDDMEKLVGKIRRAAAEIS